MGQSAAQPAAEHDANAMLALKDLRYRLEFWALRLIEALLRAVPLDLGVNVSAKAWRLLARFDHRHQRALDNLAIAFPHKTPEIGRAHV